MTFGKEVISEGEMSACARVSFGAGGGEVEEEEEVVTGVHVCV